MLCVLRNAFGVLGELAVRSVPRSDPFPTVEGDGGLGAAGVSTDQPPAAPPTWKCAQCGKESNAEIAALSETKPGYFCSARCVHAADAESSERTYLSDLVSRWRRHAEYWDSRGGTAAAADVAFVLRDAANDLEQKLLDRVRGR